MVSWCFPSKDRNSRMHTSKLLEFTFSNQTYIASFGFVSRVYLADTNTDGPPRKLCKVFGSYMNLCLWSKFTLDPIKTIQLDNISWPQVKGLYVGYLVFHWLRAKSSKSFLNLPFFTLQGLDFTTHHRNFWALSGLFKWAWKCVPHEMVGFTLQVGLKSFLVG